MFGYHVWISDHNVYDAGWVLIPPWQYPIMASSNFVLRFWRWWVCRGDGCVVIGRVETHLCRKLECLLNRFILIFILSWYMYNPYPGLVHHTFSCNPYEKQSAHLFLQKRKCLKCQASISPIVYFGTIYYCYFLAHCYYICRWRI